MPLGLYDGPPVNHRPNPRPVAPCPKLDGPKTQPVDLKVGERGVSDR